MRLDILTKIALVFFILVSVVLYSWRVTLSLFIFITVVGAIIVSLQPQYISKRKIFGRFFLYALFLLVLVTLLNGIFLREGEPVATVGEINLYAGGLAFGVTTGARLAVISMTLLMFFVTTPIRELIQFFQRVGLPAPLVVILFLSLHFIAQLPLRINQIYLAQEARGAPVRGNIVSRARAFVTILFPLVLSSISETLERGASLDARGFRGRLAHDAAVAFSPSSILLATALVLSALILIVNSLLR